MNRLLVLASLVYSLPLSLTRSYISGGNFDNESGPSYFDPSKYFDFPIDTDGDVDIDRPRYEYPETTENPLVNYIKMEPLCYSGNSVFEYSFSADGNTKYKIVLRIINDLYPSGIIFYENEVEAKTNHSYIIYDNRYTRAYNKVKITFSSSIFTLETTKEMDLVSPSQMTITDKSKTLIGSARTLYYDGSAFSYINDTYSFNGFEENIIPNYYHEIALNSLEIRSTSNNLLLNSDYKANLLITNRENLYSNFEHDEYYAVIPLKLYLENEKIKVGFNGPLFVEPRSLKMSNVKKQGYVETNHFYLPRNEMRYQGEYELNFVFEKFGSNNSNLNSRCKINALINTLGDCYNSEYCIKNSSAEIDDDLGWQI